MGNRFADQACRVIHKMCKRLYTGIKRLRVIASLRYCSARAKDCRTDASNTLVATVGFSRVSFAR